MDWMNLIDSLTSGIFKILDFISGLLSLINNRFGTSLNGGQVG